MLSTSGLKACLDNNLNPDAVVHLLESLDNVVSQKGSHVDAKELSIAFANLALFKFGGLAKGVLNYWGIKETEDIGILVFKLINLKILAKNDDDRPEDFINVIPLDQILSMDAYVESIPVDQSNTN
jgi:uncharacterized repeat protein (TIGR04138 family)